jgi:hypothetical protein
MIGRWRHWQELGGWEQKNFRPMSKRCPLGRHRIERNSLALPTIERTVMNYTMLLYENAAGFALRSDPQKSKAYWAAWPAYSKALQDAGVMVGGSGLQLPETATTLRLQKGQRQVQDGPFADTKEQLGGYFIINVPDVDTALDWAARIPAAPGSVIEVRPNLTPPG